MAMDWLFVFSVLLCFAVSTLSLPLDSGDIKEVTGVFIYPEPPQDIFNASAAKDACRSQNAALATKAQMERALQQGLETCKYGWIDEQIAVIPRRLANDKCGKGKTGLVVWKAALTKTFAAFCFQASDLKQTQTMTTDSVLSLTSTSTTTLPAQVHASTAVTPPVTTKMKPPASIPSTAPPGWNLAPETSNSPPTSKPPTAATSSSISPTSPPTLASKPSTAATSFSISPPSPPTLASKPPTAATSFSISPPSPPTLASKPSTAATSSSISPPSPPTLASKPPTAATSSSISPLSPPTLASKPPTAATSFSISPPSPPTLASKPPTAATSSSISPTSPTRASASSTTAPTLLSRSPLTSIPARFSSSSSLTVLSSTSSLSPVTPSPSPPVSRNHIRGSTLQTVSSADTSLGGVPSALIVVAVILVLLTAAGAVWYFKVKKQVFPSWSRRQQKDDTETEMWKHVDSDQDLHGNQEVEEEADKKFSDDITACLNSDNKINSS